MRTLSKVRKMYEHIVAGTSLKEMMNTTIDFRNKETVLQYNGRLIGVIVDQTPKCHPEITGDGTEYALGAAKLYYHYL